MSHSLELHHRAVVADTHNDLLMAVTARPPALWPEFFRQRWLPQLRDGGVDIQVLPVFVDGHNHPEEALRTTLRMIECAHVIAEGNPEHVRLCCTGAEIDSSLEQGRIALVLALEGAPGLSSNVELVGTVYRLGVRIASIAHWGRSALADGSSEDATGSRLTLPGVAVLREMERLGMLFDISHLGAAGVAHVLELATKPVIATHSGARALYDHHRNLTDDQIHGVVATGGVVCVNFFAPYLAADPAEQTLDRLADHIEHIAGVAGIDHVGIGPDFVREVLHDVTPPCCERPGGFAALAIPGLDGPRGLPQLTELLLKRGLPEADVLKILGGNVHRLFREQLAGGRRPKARLPAPAMDPTHPCRDR